MGVLITVCICQKSGLNTARASDKQPCLPTTQILLIDQMGLLRATFALAKIAFVGGSIADRGGHNALEPAAFGVPSVMGPYTYNNPAICQTLLDAGALYKVSDAQDIARQCRLWLENEELRTTAGQAGKTVLAANGGAIDATLKVLGLYTQNWRNSSMFHAYEKRKFTTEDTEALLHRENKNIDLCIVDFKKCYELMVYIILNYPFWGGSFRFGYYCRVRKKSTKAFASWA
jgi:hypothetical protein